MYTVHYRVNGAKKTARSTNGMAAWELFVNLAFDPDCYACLEYVRAPEEAVKCGS